MTYLPVIVTLAAASFAASTSAALAGQSADYVVKIDAGALAGQAQEGITTFKGIPFAAPPVGPRRWRAPRPVAKWKGVRDARQYGHDCMQQPFPSDAAPLGTSPSEDCLFANVWAPSRITRKLPVMVWIHGGGFVNGGSSPPTYSGQNLARQGIVVVSFNYRLGRFGTFALPQMSSANADGGLLANYGYLDQVAALRWVKRNVARFGGDPNKVTIVGESSGGTSVHMLLTSPLAMGLFRGAVIQSGGPGTEPLPTLASAEKIGIAFAASKGIASEDPRVLDRLRGLSADDVTAGLSLAAIFSPSGGVKTFSAPVADGIIAVDPVEGYAHGRFARVPVMIGATSADIGGPNGYMATGARRIAAMLADKGIPVFRYRFSYVAGSVRQPGTKGASHATEIPFFFDTVAEKYGLQTTTTDRRMGRLASAYLVNFVKTGDPNGTGLIHWPADTVAAPAMLDFDGSGNAAAEINAKLRE